MSDREIRLLENAVHANPSDEEATARLRMARIRAGQEEMPSTTYRVLELNLTGLRKKVDSYAKRATKLGVIPLQLVVSEERFFLHRGDTVLAARDVEIIGDAPDLGDWRLEARLEHLKDETVIQDFRDSLNTEILETYRARGPVCDHCKVRRIRRDTFVVRHIETNETLAVGRTCLEEFCGADPKGVLYLFNADSQLRGLASACEKVLERCKACKKDVHPVVTRQSPHGTCPDCKAELEGTALRQGLVLTSRLLLAFAANNGHGSAAAWNRARYNTDLCPTPEDGEKAMGAIAWAQDHKGNVAAVLRDRYVERRHLSLAADGYRVSQREIDSGFQGAEIRCKVIKIRSLNVWGIRGRTDQLNVGLQVIATSRRGDAQVRVARIVHTLPSGDCLATFTKVV